MDNEQEAVLNLAFGVLRFATNHPYAATGIFGAAIGSAVTYKAMTYKSVREKVDGIFTPKVYELVMTHEDLRRMLADPLLEVRLETSDVTLVLSSEQREQLKQLPDIVIDE